MCIVAFPNFFQAVGDAPRRVVAATGKAESHSAFRDRELSPASAAILVVGYILTSAFSFALGIFVLFHAYLVCKGRTTVEMYDIVDPVRAARVARYDLGMSENIRLVFGNYRAFWLLPTRFGVEGDGLSYPRSAPLAEATGSDV